MNNDELVNKIIQARNDYYNGQSKISDATYDTWIDELAKLDPKNLAVIGIGAEPISNWEKYTHKTMLGSLNKCNTEEEFKKWYKKYFDKDDDILLTLKLDGLSVSLIYENGKLITGATRGSGTLGEAITSNVAVMQGIPLKLNKKINATIRGEIMLSKENHTKYFKNYSNTRNAASGISRRYDGEGSDKLSVVAYQISSDDIEISTQEGMFIALQELEFITPSFYVLKTVQDVFELKNKYQSKLRDQYIFDLDGLVIHNNNLQKQENFGNSHGRPYASIAFKFNNESCESTIRDFVWSVGGSGRMTPVAIIDPVILVGATVSKANLYNVAYIKSLKLDVGAYVLVVRANDVIPRVEECLKPTGTIAKSPTRCPECDTATEMDGEYLICPNTDTCPAQVSGRIEGWFTTLKLLEWGPALIERLCSTGRVVTIADLYTLTVDELALMDRMGEKSARKVHQILHANKEISLDCFLGGLGIPMIGTSMIRIVMSAGYDTLEQIQNLTVAQLTNINGMGPVKAESLYRGLRKNKKLIDNIIKAGITVKEKSNGKLSGKKINFTGAMQRKRSELEQMAIDAGGEIKSGKNLDFLVIADPENSTSSKAVAARANGTKCISEETFLKMIE